MSSTSLAALAAFAGSNWVAPARADDTISVSFSDTSSIVFPTDVTGTLTINSGVQVKIEDVSAIFVDGVAATIKNSGQITATNPLVLGYGHGIEVDSTEAVSIQNIGSSSIIEVDVDGYGAAIFVGPDGSKTSISNEGQIVTHDQSTDFAAIYVAGNNTGDIVNKSTGYITAEITDGIWLSGGTLTGKINNAGVIQSNAGDLYFASAISVINTKITGGILNSGTIVNNNVNGHESYAIFVSGTSETNITNKAAGAIRALGTDGIGIFLENSSVLTGDITNEASGTIEAKGGSSQLTILGNTYGANAIAFATGSKLDGKIDNSGTIQVTDNAGASAAVAILVDGATITKGIVNNAKGSILAAGQTLGAIYVFGKNSDAATDITNSGKIASSSSNIAANTIAYVQDNNKASGTITNNADAEISIAGAGLNAILVSKATVTIANNGDIVTTSSNANTHAIQFGSTGDIINSKKIANEGATTSAALAIVDDMTGKIDNGAVSESKTTGQIFNKNSGGIAIEIAKDKTVSNNIINAGLIQGGDGTSNGDNGYAIKQDNTGTGNTEIRNQSTGSIIGRVQIAQGSLYVEGGSIKGTVTGADTAFVSFDLTPVTPATFNPLTSTFGFETEGNYLLALSGQSAINPHSDIHADQGAVKISSGNNLQADHVLTDGANTVMYFEGNNTITVGNAAGVGLANEGTMIFGTTGGKISVAGGPLTSTDPSARLGFVVRPTGGGAITPPLVEIAAGGNAINTSASSALGMRIYNSNVAFTPAVKNQTIVTTGGLTLDGNTGTALNAGMDTAFNDTATLHYQIHTGVANGNNLELDIVRTNFSVNPNLTPNEQAAGGALETVANNGDASKALDVIIGKLDTITDAAQLGNALKQLLPIANGAALFGSMAGFDSMLNSIDSRLKDYDQPGYGQQYVMAAGGDTGLSGAANGRRNGLWVRAGGAAGTQDTRGTPGGDVAGFDGRSYFGVVGVDHEAWEGLRLGLTGAFADSRYNGNSDDVNNSRLGIRNYAGSVYAAWNDPSGWYGSIAAGGGYNTYEGRRTISFTTPGGDVSDVKSSDYNGWNAGVKMMLGRTFGDEDGFNISPFVSLRYSHVTIDSYTETGVTDTALNLAVGKQNYNALLPGVGLRLATVWHAGNVTLVPFLRGTYQYDVIGDRQVTNASFGGDLGTPLTTFRTQGLQPGQQILNGGGGMSIFTSGPFSMAFNYDYEYRDNGFTSHTGYAQGRIGF